MDMQEMTLWAIGLKVGATVVAALVLTVVFVVMAKRNRKRQAELDAPIMTGKRRDLP